MSIALSEALLTHVQRLAQSLNVSPEQVVQIAIEQFVDKADEQLLSDPAPYLLTPLAENPPIIHQGDIYWLRGKVSSEAYQHPHVVIQENVLNHSRIDTVVVCALTSNLKRASYPGNVLLDINEANLPKQSVVEVSKVSTVAKAQLGEYVGSLSEQRIHQILAGMRFLQASFFSR